MAMRYAPLRLVYTAVARQDPLISEMKQLFLASCQPSYDHNWAQSSSSGF